MNSKHGGGEDFSDFSSGRVSDFVAEYLKLLRRPLVSPDVAVSFLSDALPVRDTRPCALLLSPHPDDECLTAALPLRLKQEQDWQIINVAMTLGSNPSRQAARRAELAKACAVLGFDGFEPVASGFDDVNPAARMEDKAAWQMKVTRLAELIAHYKPQAIFMPHAGDMHATHIGVYLLALEALALQAPEFTCAVFHTEFWHPNLTPNLMIGVGEADVVRILSALTCHTGEVARNPYDRRFPAYLIDNVRRGSERVGGKGVVAADMDFAMLYQYGMWKQRRFVASALGRIVGVGDTLAEILS